MKPGRGIFDDAILAVEIALIRVRKIHEEKRNNENQSDVFNICTLFNFLTVLHKLLNLLIKLCTPLLIIHFHITCENSEKKPAARFQETENPVERHHNLISGEQIEHIPRHDDVVFSVT